MSKIREDVFIKVVVDEPQNVKGVKEMELLSIVEIDHFIYPILYVEIGLGNCLLNTLCDWIDYTIEEITDDERNERKNLVSQTILVEQAKQDLEDFDDVEGNELSNLKVRKKHYMDLLNYVASNADEKNNK